MNQLFRSIGYFFLSISLVACSGPAVSSTAAVTVLPSITVLPLSTPTVMEVNTSKENPEFVKNTDTVAPSVTPTPVHTINFTATQTPTVTKTIVFNPSSIQTVTPAPAAKCPTPSTGNVPTPNFVNSKEWVVPSELMEDVLDFLNLYGAGAVYAEYRAHLQKNDGIDWDLNFSDYLDLTNDGVKELIANIGGYLFIIGCQEGHYAVLDMRQADGAMWFPSILEVADANRNGMPEAILYLGGTTGNGSFYQVIEWDGHKFQDLLIPFEDVDNNYSSSDLFIGGGEGSKLKQKDFDQDGVEEYIATIGIPIGETYVYGIPWRKETQIYKWNGQQFVSYRRIFTAPQYRFQAVQDGDRATLEGEYEKALDFYQQAIFSDKLEWWSPDRLEFLQEVFLGSFWKTNDPTPVPPVPDPKEYDNLAAYARYRIMLLHLARGWVSDARVVYDTLQTKYPEGKPGHDYAALAETVWTEFEQSKELGKACAKGVKYASYRPVEIYYYIGGSRNPGNHGIDYNLHPKFVCPFH